MIGFRLVDHDAREFLAGQEPSSSICLVRPTSRPRPSGGRRPAFNSSRVIWVRRPCSQRPSSLWKSRSSRCRSPRGP